MKSALSCLAAFLLGVGLLAGIPASAAPLPLTGKDVRQAEEEKKQGAEAAVEVAKALKFSPDSVAQARVDRIGQRLAKIANETTIPARYGTDHVYPFIWKFFVVDAKDVNAFSLPGGYVYVNAGLLDFVRSDDELAGVLAHEVTHASHHHFVALAHEQSKMSTQMAIGLIAALLAHIPANDLGNLAQGAQYVQMGVMNTRFSQAAERDADRGGTILMEKAGFNAVGMLTFMQRLADMEKRSVELDLGILRDHPYTAQRVGLIRDQLAVMNVAVTREAVSLVSGAARADVRAVGTDTAQLLLGKRPLVTLADPDGARCLAASKVLNVLLDQGLQMYQVRAEGAVVIAADRTLLTLTAADARLRPNATPDTLAEDAARALRAGLWAQTVTGSNVP